MIDWQYGFKFKYKVKKIAISKHSDGNWKSYDYFLNQFDIENFVIIKKCANQYLYQRAISYNTNLFILPIEPLKRFIELTKYSPSDSITIIQSLTHSDEKLLVKGFHSSPRNLTDQTL